MEQTQPSTTRLLTEGVPVNTTDPPPNPDVSSSKTLRRVLIGLAIGAVAVLVLAATSKTDSPASISQADPVATLDRAAWDHCTDPFRDWLVPTVPGASVQSHEDRMKECGPEPRQIAADETTPDTLPADAVPVTFNDTTIPEQVVPATEPPTTQAPFSPPRTTSAFPQIGGEDLAIPGAVPLAPACDGSYIVIVRSATTPMSYRRAVAEGIASAPGARYFRTFGKCASLRYSTDKGNDIYAVYLGPFPTLAEACANKPVSAYVKRLSSDIDPKKQQRCR